MRKRRKKHAKKGEPIVLTKAVTHIRLVEANPSKLVALDQLADVYLALTQQYVTLFCTSDLLDAFHAPCFPTRLSERWQRVAIQQAAGIAKSWRTNRANAESRTGDAHRMARRYTKIDDELALSEQVERLSGAIAEGITSLVHEYEHRDPVEGQ